MASLNALLHAQRMRRFSPEMREQVESVLHVMALRKPPTEPVPAFPRRRARPGTALTETQWAAILQEHDYECVFCGTTEDITKDHVVPRSKGGLNIAENVVPVCRSCNSWKAAKLWLEDNPD